MSRNSELNADRINNYFQQHAEVYSNMDKFESEVSSNRKLKNRNTFNNTNREIVNNKSLEAIRKIHEGRFNNRNRVLIRRDLGVNKSDFNQSSKNSDGTARSSFKIDKEALDGLRASQPLTSFVQLIKDTRPKERFNEDF